MAIRRLNDLVLASIAGVLTFVSFPTDWFPDVSLYPLIWFSHVPLLWLLRDKGPKAAFFGAGSLERSLMSEATIGSHTCWALLVVFQAGWRRSVA